MYLDTDVLLALLKEKDWLKQFVTPEKVRDCCTSVLNVLEAKMVLLREEGTADKLISKLKSLKITLLPIDEAMLEKSEDLLSTHEHLGIFDSMHAATCFVKNEKMFSTDHIYDELELERIDPRD